MLLNRFGGGNRIQSELAAAFGNTRNTDMMPANSLISWSFLPFLRAAGQFLSVLSSELQITPYTFTLQHLLQNNGQCPLEIKQVVVSSLLNIFRLFTVVKVFHCSEFNFILFTVQAGPLLLQLTLWPSLHDTNAAADCYPYSGNTSFSYLLTAQDLLTFFSGRLISCHFLVFLHPALPPTPGLSLPSPIQRRILMSIPRAFLPPPMCCVAGGPLPANTRVRLSWGFHCVISLMLSFPLFSLLFLSLQKWASTYLPFILIFISLNLSLCSITFLFFLLKFFKRSFLCSILLRTVLRTLQVLNK